jgi:uncharacterized protein (DUF4415 family)
MPQTIKTRSGRTLILPTPEEDAIITAAAMSDPDCMPYTDEEWEKIKPLLRVGRPKAEVTKERITIRLSRDVVTQFRASGTGWQTRVDAALREYLATHPIGHA